MLIYCFFKKMILKDDKQLLKQNLINVNMKAIEGTIQFLGFLQLQYMEDYCLEVKGQVQQIYKVLSKDKNDKMPFEGIEIAKTLAKLPFFQRNFETNSEQFINLCISQDVLEFPQRTDIYSKQKEGNERYVYVILEGTILISSTSSTKRTLGVLRIFGQTEILYGLTDRKETVVSVSSCKLMRIKENSILKIFSQRDQIFKTLHFLNVNSYFQKLSELEKMQLGQVLVKRSFVKGECFKIQNEGLETIFYIICGKVEVLTRLELNGKQKQFSIDSLEEMSSFGQYECLTKQATSVKLRSKTSGSYYILQYGQMVREQHKIIEIIMEKAVPYPNNEQLIFLEGVKSTIFKEEKRVMKDMRYPFYN